MKKVLSLALAVVLTFGMASVAFAAAAKVEIDENSFAYGASGKTAYSGYVEFSTTNDGYTEADSKIQVYINPKSFNNLTGALTTSKLSSANYTVKRKVTKGSEVIKSIELKNDNKLGTVYIEIKFVDPFVSTGEKDYDFTIYLAEKSKKIDATELQIGGTMKNPEITVDEDTDEVDLSEGAYAKAEDYVKSIKVDTGNGLFVNTKMFDGQKYYAKSVQEITASDDAVISKYPEIDTVYTLYTVNMNSAGNTVTLDVGDTYYVYDATGKYIGTSGDKLPMSSKYYLATSKIDMGNTGVEEEEPGETTVPEDGNTGNAGTGGDDVPENVNDNPGTGANGFVNVAVVAGLVAAAAAVSLKK